MVNNYFPHDSNARNNDKLLSVRMKYGAEGYGIYFMLLERLRDEKNYMSVKDYNMLAFDLRVDAAKLKSVVEEFGLFAFTETEDGECFYSDGFQERMEIKDVKSEKARAAANKRWDNANAMQTHSECNASKVNKSKVEERKLKKTKENKNIVSDSGNDFIESGTAMTDTDSNFETYLEIFKDFTKKVKSVPRAKALVEFLKLIPDQQVQAITGAKNYVDWYKQSGKDIEFSKNAAVFLKDMIFMDYLEPVKFVNRSKPTKAEPKWSNPEYHEEATDEEVATFKAEIEAMRRE